MRSYDTLSSSGALDDRTAQALARLETLARLMDSSFVIPGTSARFGIDALIGLVPVVGDVVAGTISSYLIWEARRLKAPPLLIGRMIANTVIDSTLGAIPVLGDALDVVFRANTRNIALLRRHLESTSATRPAGKIIEGEAVRID